MKIYLVKLPPFGEDSDKFFTVGKIYDGDLSLTMYDPNTLQPAPATYLVKCDGGYLRKVDAEYFITVDEWRQIQLDKIL